MRALAFLLPSLLMLLPAGPALAAPTDGAEAHYQSLLAAAKTAAPNVDWAQLRLAYADRPGFSAFAQSPAKAKMFQAAEASDCKAALPAARQVIADSYVDADAHMVAAFCEDAAGDAVAARLDRDIGRGLVHSIATGDGLSPATAFTPIDVDEEYALMRALGLRVSEQALVRQGGHSYDLLNATDEHGQKAGYYFLVDRVLAAEAAALKPGAITEGGPPSRTP